MTDNGKEIKPGDKPSAGEDGKKSRSRKRRPLIRQSYLIALLFTGALAAWMWSGDIIVGGRQDGKASTALSGGKQNGERAKLFRVRVKTYTARPRKAHLLIRGQSEADARVTVKAETAGMVLAIPVRKGTFVAKDTLLCTLDRGVRESMLLQTRAQLAQAKADHEATSRLAERGHSPKLQIIANRAKYDTAMAAVKTAELDLARTRITAPFAGILEEQSAKVGDFLGIGSACATLVAIDPLVVRGYVSERDIGKIKTGMTARTSLITGEKRQGKIRYIASSADPKTRTFRVEVEVANPGNRLRDGVTADIVIPLKPQPAQRFSSSLLTLDSVGRIGVRIVDEKNIVQFRPVKILSQDKDGVWAGGLPDRITLITTGQDYVVAGQKVDPVGAEATQPVTN